MDHVHIFSDELHSLLDIKPPVSKAKMGLITRAAMKGVKFYKHIVQSVEKFILKCRPEYKVPGLYVIDSIVRQSRHQFGIERDVYATRFERNLPETFRSLFSECYPEDKPRMIRVLNLWQKNGVFTAQVIQPLLDMASNPIIQDMSNLSAASTSSDAHKSSTDLSSRVMHQFETEGPGRDTRLKFSKNMLDFDYEEDDDDDDEGDETPTEAEPPLSSTLNKIGMDRRHRTTTNDYFTSSTNKPSHLDTSKNYQHYQSADNQQSNNQPDAVLERWNRLIKEQSTTNSTSTPTNPTETDKSTKATSKDIKPRRSRSRSPVQRTSCIQPQADKYSNKDKPRADKLSSEDEDVLATRAARDKEREAERARKCLPRIRDKHLTVCSSTLWLGHVPKSVTEADISNAFGEYGTITSIDLIPPRGCAYVCMDRRQDARRALKESKDLKLNGSHIKMAWAPGRGFKEYKKLKDFWEVDTGSSYIPYSRIDESIDFDVLEEGGVIDEDSMSMEMRERRERKLKEKENPHLATMSSSTASASSQQQHHHHHHHQHHQQQSQTNLPNLPKPQLPLLSQPPPLQPSATLPPFTVPPPANLNIPPPTHSQGAVPPPPFVMTSTCNTLNVAPVSTQPSLTDLSDAHKSSDATLKSPSTIDEQLNMTVRQINMVEQQLSMIQQAHGIQQPPIMTQPPIHPPEPVHALLRPSLMAPQPFLMHGPIDSGPDAFANLSALMGFPGSMLAQDPNNFPYNIVDPNNYRPDLRHQ